MKLTIQRGLATFERHDAFLQLHRGQPNAKDVDWQRSSFLQPFDRQGDDGSCAVICASQPIQRVLNADQLEVRRSGLESHAIPNARRHDFPRTRRLLGDALPSSSREVEQRLCESEVEDRWRRAAWGLRKSIRVDRTAPSDEVRSQSSARQLGFADRRPLPRFRFADSGIVLHCK
jgi:hypothetical protein